MGYRFQECFTGVQIIVWNHNNEISAKNEFSTIVINPHNWILLGSVDAKSFHVATKEI